MKLSPVTVIVAALKLPLSAHIETAPGVVNRKLPLMSTVPLSTSIGLE